MRLDVDAIVTGSAGQIQGQIQFQARLTRLPGEHEVWSERYNRIQSEAQSLQKELARNIAEQIGGGLRSEDEPRPTQAFDSELHDHYVRGRLFASEPGREELERGIDILARVIKQDPGHAEAYSATAEAWS
jgi:hypothetical protein